MDLKILLQLSVTCFTVCLFCSCSKSDNKGPTPPTQSDLAINSLNITAGSYMTEVEINGAGFSSDYKADLVYFNGKKAQVNYASSTKLYVYVPLAAGTGDLKITVGNATVNGPVFTYIPTLVVTSLAGNGNDVSKDGQGDAASFAEPAGMTIDSKGNIYLADAGANEIRKITPDGVVSTFAGSSTAGFVDGDALTARFDHPNGITMDQAGNFFIADTRNNRIRKIAADGKVSTIAGNQMQGSVDGTGSAASFNSPSDIAVDESGNLYVADMGNNIIRKISSGNIVSTFAGGGDDRSNGVGTHSGFTQPGNITYDKKGNLYISEQFWNRVRKITCVGAVVSTYSTGGQQGFASPRGLTIDSKDDLYVTDLSRKVKKIDQAGTVTSVTTDFSSQTPPYEGPVEKATLGAPVGISMNSSGVIYIADAGYRRIFKISVQ